MVKYADNILKNISTCLAIVLSSLISMHLFGFRPNLLFVVGAILVLLAVMMYVSASRRKGNDRSKGKGKGKGSSMEIAMVIGPSSVAKVAGERGGAEKAGEAHGSMA